MLKVVSSSNDHDQRLVRTDAHVARDDDPLVGGAAGHVHSVDPWLQYICIRPAVRVGRQAEPLARQVARDIEGPPFSSPLNEALAFTARHRASVRSIPTPPRRALRSAWISSTAAPSSRGACMAGSSMREKQTSDTRTTARPSRRTAPPPPDRSTLAWSGLLDRMSARTTLPESGQDGRVFARTNLDGWIRQCRWGSGPSHRRARQR